MEKEITVYLHIKTPSDDEFFKFLDELHAFLDRAKLHGDTDFNLTSIPYDGYGMKR